jgi:hypothetical protein
VTVVLFVWTYLGLFRQGGGSAGPAGIRHRKAGVFRACVTVVSPAFGLDDCSLKCFERVLEFLRRRTGSAGPAGIRHCEAGVEPWVGLVALYYHGL